MTNVTFTLCGDVIGNMTPADHGPVVSHKIWYQLLPFSISLFAQEVLESEQSRPAPSPYEEFDLDSLAEVGTSSKEPLLTAKMFVKA